MVRGSASQAAIASSVNQTVKLRRVGATTSLSGAPLRTGRADCSASGSSLCRFVSHPLVMPVMAPPVQEASGRRGRSGPGCALRRPPSRPNRHRTTSSAVARRSVRLSPSNVSDRHWRPGPWLPLRPAGSLRPFGPGLPRLCGPYPPHYRAAFACSGSPLPPPSSPSLAVGLPSRDGTSGAYPVARRGDATGAAAPFRPAGVGVTVASGAIWRSDPLTFWSRPPASWACSTVTDFRRAFACAQPSGLR